MESLNIFQRINKICEELEPLRKDVTVKMGAGSYKAISHDNVTTEISDLMCKYGVVAVPDELNQSQEYREFTNKDGYVSGKFIANVTMEVAFFNQDNPQEYVKTKMSATAHDANDKAYGKAQSMAVKYCYLKLFRMQTNADEESREPTGNKMISEKQMELLRKNFDKLTEEEVNKLKLKTMDATEASTIIGRILGSKK